jgi:N-terminal domain of toast_rack, DUF2154
MTKVTPLQHACQDGMKQPKQPNRLNHNGDIEMNKQKARFWMVIKPALLLLCVLLLAGCGSRTRVGELRTESRSVEMGDANPVHADIEIGAGSLELSGGAQKLLEADFTYNVDRLKPEVTYTDGRLVIQHPEASGMPALQGITDFRNEWNLRFNDAAPMDLRVNMGAGVSDLKLAGLSLTGADISLGAGSSTIDLSGDWAHDLDLAIDAGATNLSLRLPKDIGVRVEIDAGIGRVDAPGMTKEGNVYTNAAYGVSPVTLQVKLQAGVGQINLEVEE